MTSDSVAADIREQVRHRARRCLWCAWITLFTMGTSSIVFNVYHAVSLGRLNAQLSWLFGVIPVLIGMLMSEIAATYDAAERWMAVVFKTVTFLIMGGGMVFSMHATADVVGATAGAGFRWGFGLQIDAAAMAALFVVLNPARVEAIAARRLQAATPVALDPAAALAHVPADQPAPGVAYQPADEPPVTAHKPADEPVAHEPAPAPAASRPAAPRPPKPLDRDAEAAAARKAYRDSAEAGTPLSKRKLAEQFGRSPTWAEYRINEVKNGPQLAATAQ